jgi:hypothetical protein
MDTKTAPYAELESNLYKLDEGYYTRVLRDGGWDDVAMDYKVGAYGSPLSEKEARQLAKSLGLKWPDND